MGCELMWSLRAGERTECSGQASSCFGAPPQTYVFCFLFLPPVCVAAMSTSTHNKRTFCPMLANHLILYAKSLSPSNNKEFLKGALFGFKTPLSRVKKGHPFLRRLAFVPSLLRYVYIVKVALSSRICWLCFSLPASACVC